MTERTAVVRDIGDGSTIASVPLSLPTDPSGSSGIDWMPPQCAIVLSLRTGIAGRSYRGRVYLPGFSRAAASAQGRIDTTTRDLLADKFALYLSTVHAATAGSQPVVYSKTLTTLSNVTEVQCGDVWDTQRRRRDALVEARHTATV